MKSEQKNPSTMRDHEMKNEGGRESGHVHEPSQTQQASRKQGLADDTMHETRKQQGQQAPGHQQSGSGSHQCSSSQQGKPPGSSSPGSTRDRNREHQSDKKSA
jgi:hypothetical protein